MTPFSQSSLPLMLKDIVPSVSLKEYVFSWSIPKSSKIASHMGEFSRRKAMTIPSFFSGRLNCAADHVVKSADGFVSG